METFQRSSEAEDAAAAAMGCDKWNNAALPHAGTTQSGASRSVAPARLARRVRCLEERKRASLNWYLSMKREEGRVRCVWSLHEGFGGVRCCFGKERMSVGWRPVGWENEVV